MRTADAQCQPELGVTPQGVGGRLNLALRPGPPVAVVRPPAIPANAQAGSARSRPRAFVLRVAKKDDAQADAKVQGFLDGMDRHIRAALQRTSGYRLAPKA